MSGAREKAARARLVAFVVSMVFAPTAAIVWIGCGDDDASPSSSLGRPDPGGTWGAQVAVTLVGRGRVTGGGLDCPGSSDGCFSTVVFPNNAADGATGGVTLTAEPTSGERFLGWSFEPVSLGASGRGPDRCNPITRAAAVPAVDANALSITLPYGEVDGTSPAGREAECAAYRKVPVAYEVVASFETGELPDAGRDAAGDGGVNDPVSYDVGENGGAAPVVLGRTSNGYVYVRYSSSGFGALGVGLAGESSGTQFLTSIAGVTGTLGRARVEPTGVVFEQSGSLAVIRQTSPTTVVTVGSTASIGTCQQIAMDTGSNVHCRTSTSIATWKYNGADYDTPVVTFTDLPSGNDLAVDTSTFYYSTATEILRVPLSGTDASAPEVVISGTSNVLRLVAGTSKLAWITTEDVNVSTDKFVGSDFQTLGFGTAITSGVFALTFAPFEPATLYVGSQKAIYVRQNAGSWKAFRSGKTYTGMAIGSQYVLYSVSGDTKIYRASRLGS